MSIFKNLAIMLVCAMSYFSTVYSAETDFHKIYVPEDSIELSTEGLFIYAENELLHVDNLSEDSCYVLVAEAGWNCRGCWRNNERKEGKCSRCNRSRGK